MNIKQVLLNDLTLDINNLVEIGDGVLDISDNCITFDGKTWRDARTYELEQVYSKMSAEKVIHHTFANKHTEECMIDDDRPDIRNDNGYVQRYAEDTYLQGLDKGFIL